MGQNVGIGQIKPSKRDPKPLPISKDMHQKDAAQLGRLYVSQGVSFSGANKGLFLGLLTLVTVIVVVIIFLVVRDDMDFASDTLFWMTSTTLAAILSASALLGCVGLYQVRKLCHNGDRLSSLDSMLATASGAGVVLYALFGIMVGAVGVATLPVGSPEQKIDTMLTVVNALQLIHVALQSSLIAETYRRSSWSRHQLFTKPGRQVRVPVLFVLFYFICLNVFQCPRGIKVQKAILKTPIGNNYVK